MIPPQNVTVDIELNTLRGDGSSTGKDECLPELPGSGLPAVTTCRGNDIQWETHSPPPENGIGSQVDTIHMHLVHTEEGQGKKLVKQCYDKELKG